MPEGTERFLVTGSEGCIGSWVVRNLLESGLPVVATDIAPRSLRVERIVTPELLDRLVYVTADLTAAGVLDELVAENEITRIVHLAALQVPLVVADPLRGAEVNVVGTIRVLEAARRSSTVAGVSYASSSAVFGSNGQWGRSETLYGVFKAANEESARFYARDYETPSIGLRPCVVYGPNRDQGFSAAITHALKAAVLGLPYTIPFHGRIDLQYAQDVAAAFVGVTLADQAALVEQEVPNSAGQITIGPSPVPGRVEFDDTPLRGVVGELPKTSLAEGIRSSVELFRRQADTGFLTREGFEAVTGPS
jgi:nucleoside-diphosphate-sugar epimerase